jgi:hypothetical protein
MSETQTKNGQNGPNGAAAAAVLRVGDTVMWRGNFGRAAWQRATVIRIEETEHPRTKYGQDVAEILWSAVRNNYACLDLDNGSWCYGEQVAPWAGAPVCGVCGSVVAGAACRACELRAVGR